MADQPSPIAGLPLTTVRAHRQAAEAGDERARVAQLAQEFEAMLMLQMVKQMRQSLLDEREQPQGLGGSTMQDTFDAEWSRSLAAAGGIGLGAFLARQIEARQLEASAPGVETVPLLPQLLSETRHPAAPGGRPTDDRPVGISVPLPLEGQATSPFGWRADPFTGRSRFHAGVDLRAAYGTTVPAAAAGEVVFAGERGAYGNLVILRHEDGLETRYAHLASVEVQAGERIEEGLPIGRVGSTGRSTAPHLHFEVLVNGERVDPAVVAGRLGRGPLKSGARADD